MSTARPSLSDARRLIDRVLLTRSSGEPRTPHKNDDAVRQRAAVLAVLLTLASEEIPDSLTGGAGYAALPLQQRAYRLVSRAYRRPAALDVLAESLLPAYSLKAPEPAPSKAEASERRGAALPASRYVVPCSCGCGVWISAPSPTKPAVVWHADGVRRARERARAKGRPARASEAFAA